MGRAVKSWRSKALRLLVAYCLAAFTVCFGALRANAAGPTVNGGGSSFAGLEISQWKADVAKKPYELKINYQAQGSSFGRQQYIAGNLDFGASDIEFQPEELDALAASGRSEFVYVPISAGGLGFMYNLTDSSGAQIEDLRLTRRVVCRIFTEAGMQWNDSELVADNPRLADIARPIIPIVRQDGSGTSFVMSEFCINVAPDVWGAFVADRTAKDSANLPPAFLAGSPVSNWPTGWGSVTSALYADGVADGVLGQSDAITYNEAGFAKARRFPNASVQNAANVFVQPVEEAVTLALGYADGRPNGTFKLDYGGADPRAYFPSTYSYAIAQTTGFDPAKGEVLARFLCYAVTKGQEKAAANEYARLSNVLVDLALRSIAQIPGAPAQADCVVSSTPPPPPPTTIAGTVAPTVPTTVAGGGSGTGGSGSGGSGAGGSGTGGSTGGDASGGGGSSGGGSSSGGGTGAGSSGGSQSGSTGGSATGGVSPVGGTPTGTTPAGLAPGTPADSGAGGADVLASGAATDGDYVVFFDQEAPGAGGQTDSAAGAGGNTGAKAPAAAGNPGAKARSTGGTSNSEVFWVLVQGGLLCGVGLIVSSATRRGAAT